ncbi:MAG: mannitol dehydrogenase [Spirochaetes bacterium]|nr:mannitol dehydrogenase [Spirochaetota bacterium]
MKKAVIFGAGNIGRGFIGQLFFESGYYTTFIDVNRTLVRDLNNRHSYPLRILEASTGANTDLLIENVDALDARNIEAITIAVSEADILATAVGAEILPQIALHIANALMRRFELGAMPLNILLCENLKNAGAIASSLIRSNLPASTHPWFDRNVGLVETSIGRMVPLQTPESMDGDPLRICVESYSTLPANKEAFCKKIPEIIGLQAVSPFSFYIDRKLYIHNMGHALAAYHGDTHGMEFIWQAVGHPGIRAAVYSAMCSCADALVISYGAEKQELYNHVEDLLHRFANRKLGDTVYRVGRNLRRKLAPEDRLVGALRLCQKAGTPIDQLTAGLALAMRFSSSDLKEMSPETILTEICDISPDEKIYTKIINAYNRHT